MDALPDLEAVRALRQRLGDLVLETPVLHWRSPEVERRFGGAGDIEVWLKLELFQRAGTFKPRGALAVMLGLDPGSLGRGVTAVSAGNHAMAVGYAAQVLGTTAKVVMPKNANPGRIAGCKAYGATVVLVDDVHAAFDEVRRIEREEGRTFVHPFEGPQTVLGTATLGLELAEQVPDLDAVIVPIGGGGLCAGVAMAMKLAQPNCTVFGVEPEGADTMHRSFESGKPEAIDQVRTIADSLGAPHAAPYTLDICQRFVDRLCKVSDAQIRDGMRLLLEQAKLAVEPAGAAATAALAGPLHKELCSGRSDDESRPPKKVAVIVCGSNIDVASYTAILGEH